MVKNFVKVWHDRITPSVVAFVLVLSSVAASVPLFLSQTAEAVGGVVRPGDSNWIATGSPAFVAGPTGATEGSLKLSTLNAAKQSYLYNSWASPVSLSAVNSLSYRAYVESGIPVSYQLQVTGSNGAGFTSLVWEPVYNGHPNGPNGGFVNYSSLENGTWWSSSAIGSAPDRNTFVSLDAIKAANPNAKVVAFGVNVGSGTPNAISYVDSLAFNGSSYNFEPTLPESPANLKFFKGTGSTEIAPSSYVSDPAVRLKWNAIANIERYQVRVTDPQGNVQANRHTGTPFFDLNDGIRHGHFSTKEGTWKYEVRVKDNNGLWSSYSAPIELTFDKTKPVLALPQNVVMGEAYTFNVSQTELHPDKTYVEIQQLVNNKWQKFSGEWFYHTNSFPFTVDAVALGLQEGIKTQIKVSTWDKASNHTSSTVAATVDLSAPSITIKPGSIGNGNYWQNVSLKLSDKQKVDKIVVNDVVKDLVDSEWSDLNGLKPGAFGGVEGENTIVLYDVAGNKTTLILTLDTTKPAAPQNGAPSVTNTNDFWFTWDAVSDSGSPIVEYEFQTSTDPSQTSGILTNVQWKNKDSSDRNHLTEPKIHSYGASDAVWYWQVRAIDAAGNVGQWSTIWALTLDTTPPPAPVLSSDLGAATSAPSGTFSWTGPSDADHYVFKLDDGPEVTHTDLANLSKQQTLTGLAEGTHTFSVKAVDTAGNSSAWASTAFIYDISGPAVTITANQPISVAAGAVGSMSGTVSDAHSDIQSVRVYVNGGFIGFAAVDNGAWIRFLPAQAQGNHVITVDAVDTLGNATAASKVATTTWAVTSSPDTNTRFPAFVPIAPGNGTPNRGAQVLATQGTTSASAVAAAETEAVDGAVAENEKEIIDKASSAFQWWWLIVVAAAGLFFIIAWRRRRSDEK